ncbi:hypothetical protein QYM36_013578, partial [Artemia franciscana]
FVENYCGMLQVFSIGCIIVMSLSVKILFEAYSSVELVQCDQNRDLSTPKALRT